MKLLDLSSIGAFERYVIGDAKCEILSCMDDTIHNSNNINSTSLVIRMELG